MMRGVIAVLTLMAGCSGWVEAQDEPSAPKFLTAGPGVEITTARCVLCHDATHITRTRLSSGEWEFNIKNMIERGAPIAPAEIAPILEYLATYYNRDKAPPPAQPAAATAMGDASELATRHACIACHSEDKRVVGPSFREIAAKYAGDGKAREMLALRVKAGSSGVWGTAAMPPHAVVPQADIALLVNWILSRR